MLVARARSAVTEQADGIDQWFGHCAYSMELSFWLQEISLVTDGGAVGNVAAADGRQPPRRSVDSRAMSLPTSLDVGLAGSSRGGR